MAAVIVCDKATMLNSNTDTLMNRLRDSSTQRHCLPFTNNRHDRRSVDLSASGGNNRLVRNVANRSLMMPVATSCHSLLTSTTTTLSSVLETDDHDRIASYNASSSVSSLGKTLRPQPQSSTSVQNGISKSSLINDSATSSPSTTSTLNSALTDTSPVSSPQSPSSILHSPFRNHKATNGTSESQNMQMDHNRKDDVSPVRPSTSMSDSAALRKGRNMKNLSINTNGISAKANIDSRSDKNDPPRPATQAGPAPTFKPGNLPAVSESAPASPSFIIPKMPPRRKPSKLGLTISTPESEQKAVIPPTPGFAVSFASRNGAAPAPLATIPATPAFPPALNLGKAGPIGDKLMSPSLGPPGGMAFPSVTGKELRTPGLAPFGGMTLPPHGSADSSPSNTSNYGNTFSLHRQRSADTMSTSSEIVNQTIAYTNSIPQSDRPLSQEVKSPSYPSGPACIYPPNVYLYHQPTADEARDFDVIINVAREVTNPFEIEAEEEKAKRNAKNTEPVQPKKSSYRSVGVQVELLTEDFPPRGRSTGQPLHSAASDVSFQDAMERLDIVQDEEAPLTPKATKFQPEYIHLPWEHNSKVYEEWYEICKLIDERVKQGKRVLIHCQLGVSRSASLIVAYGIYQNPQLAPDEAREQAKQRSRWIDLNMHFMYELGDFKKLLREKGVPGAEISRSTPSFPETPRSTAPKPSFPSVLHLHRAKTDSAMLSPVLSMPPTPMSAVSDISGSAPISSDESRGGQFAMIPDSGLSTPGPSSANDLNWPPSKHVGVYDKPSVPMSVLPIRSGVTSLSNSTRLPAPVDPPQRQPSPALRTPGFADMPGGWAKTPADSRPVSMVFPSDNATVAEPQQWRPTERTPTQMSPIPSPDPSIQSTDDKPKRPASFRGLPRMPSFGSGLSTLGSFFLKRSSSSASKRSRTESPVPSETTSPNPERRTSTQALTPIIRHESAGERSPDLKKPPSLPSLRTMFKGSTPPHKHTLNLTLEPIPQSAVGTGPTENELAAMMSPRAQEFVSSPFVRPTTSHHAMPGLTMDQHKEAEGKSSGGRKRQSLSLEEMNALNATNAAVNQLAMAGLKRAESGSGNRRNLPPVPIVPVDGVAAVQGSYQEEGMRELLSPGAQERDPRSPANHGTLAKEERVLPNIGDVL